MKFGKTLGAFNSPSQWMLLAEKRTPTTSELTDDFHRRRLPVDFNLVSTATSTARTWSFLMVRKWYRPRQVQNAGFAIGGAAPLRQLRFAHHN
jgi:hypothetical protein